MTLGEMMFGAGLVVMRARNVINKVTYRGLDSECFLWTIQYLKGSKKSFDDPMSRGNNNMVANCLEAKDRGLSDVASVPHRSPRSVACKSDGNAGID